MSRWPALALGLILLLAAVLRCHALTRSGFWVDEQWTMMMSSGGGTSYTQWPIGTWLEHASSGTDLRTDRSVISVWTTASSDIHPPLYLLAVRLWRSAWGSSDLSVRLLSVIASIAAVALTYIVGRKVTSRSASLAAALLMALAPQEIHFGQQARSYAVATALVLTAAWALEALRERSTWPRRAAVIGLTAALLLTHYLALGAVVGMTLRAVCSSRRRALLPCLLGGVALFAIAWMPFVLTGHIDTLAGSGWLYEAGGLEHHMRTFYRLAAVPTLLLADNFRASPATGVVALLVLISLPLLMVRQGQRGMLLVAACLICSIGLVVAADTLRSTKSLTEPRYTILAMPWICLALGAIPTLRLPSMPRFARALAGVPVIVAVVLVVNLRSAYAPRYGDWRVVASPVAEDWSRTPPSQRRPLVVLGTGPTMLGDARYRFLCVQRYLPGGVGAVLLLEEAADAAALEHLADAGEVWVIGPQSVDPAAFIAGATPAQGFKPVLEAGGPGQVGLFRIER